MEVLELKRAQLRCWLMSLVWIALLGCSVLAAILAGTLTGLLAIGSAWVQLYVWVCRAGDLGDEAFYAKLEGDDA